MGCQAFARHPNPCSNHLLHFKDVEFLIVGGGAGDVRGQVASAFKGARDIGEPLVQRQRHIGGLQQCPRAARCPVGGRK